MTELTGAELDLAVAKATGNTHYLDLGEAWHPSTNWAQGGPLVEEHKIQLEYCMYRAEDEPSCDCPGWIADLVSGGRQYFREGPTPLIAACRAIVASKEEV